jgi:mevalonate kinase
VKKISARAPAKLILSGEHAVLHGVPALAMAVNLYCDTTISANSLPRVLFDLANLDHKRSRTLQHLRRLKAKIQQDYHAFLEGSHSIREVLREPFHLLEYTTSAFMDKLNVRLQEGFQVHTHSSIPTGYGLGSSAAAVVSTNFALNHFLGKDLSLDDLFQLNLDAENLQHGKSSGLDIYVSAHGGLVSFSLGKIPQKLVWPVFPLCLVLTGEPISSTGECVEHSKGYFEQHPSVLAEFSAVSEAMRAALDAAHFEAFAKAVIQNQRLLECLGVVPSPVQAFIQALHTAGLPAKVCGAGAIRGDAAGVVAVFAPKDTVTTLLPQDRSWSIIDAIIDLQGVHYCGEC